MRRLFLIAFASALLSAESAVPQPAQSGASPSGKPDKPDAADSAATAASDPARRLALDLNGGMLELLASHPGQTAAVTLERGELSLLTRAWLAQHALRSLDIQYFIWTADNVGRLAMDGMLAAAERGVRVRVLVDDLMLDIPPDLLAAMDGHPNLEIKVYNPNTNTGVGFWRKLWNVLTGFRAINQRMHNKALIVDSLLAVTGGRNLADEYFDFHHGFDFRDRDILVAGPAAGQMETAFGDYWASALSRPVSELVPALAPDSQASVRAAIHAYAADTLNFAPDVRNALDRLPRNFGAVLADAAWGEARFIVDAPGKNDGSQGLAGGGVTTRFLAELLRSARHSVTIQSPYLIPDEATLALFRELTAKGIAVRISTNSMANNDNLKAVSGYLKRRKEILAAGVRVFEFKPEPGIQRKLQERYAKLEAEKPVFVIHAKTLVVDGARLFVGTFNLDPRSMHLNTESGIFLENARVAREVEMAIESDMAAENSWDASRETGDSHAPFWRRVQVWFWKLLPMEAIL
ncbi:MAG: phospholipase superfamily protein [Fibrobacteres bacterium]|nr:phospholipase superfamily protein [Fibrobacterota bacterium]